MNYLFNCPKDTQSSTKQGFIFYYYYFFVVENLHCKEIYSTVGLDIKTTNTKKVLKELITKYFKHKQILYNQGCSRKNNIGNTL